jgi:predicted 3-demethylubiquinone-9 3-methyltransferase (glyoxalase superfamily)
MSDQPKITPFLWFDGNAEEAMNFYVSVFDNSRVLSASPMAVTFELEGQRFHGLNGGPQFKFNEAISMFVNCETQEEVDDLWAKLSEGGAEQRCGWLKDKFGLSWQIITAVLGNMQQYKNRAKAQKVQEAMLKMTKIDIAGLRKAYDAA